MTSKNFLVYPPKSPPTEFGRVWWVYSQNHGKYAATGDSVEDVLRDYRRGFPDSQDPVIYPGDWDAVASLAERGYPIIDPIEWEPNPDRPEGYIREKRRKTLWEVAQELLVYLGDEHVGQVERPLGPLGSDADKKWPEGRIIAFSVRGGSEGDWTHVGVVSSDGNYQGLLLSKTFSGRDESWATAKRIADLLGC